ncbi:bifunctional serine/threonine-protein kinase/glutamate ABC transporter substrate-binding protein [Sphaerisporangium aureirubrum]|uniref:Bifunctional serine/threonine-protein kinase/glutamate ABC transporter substrate-binding protein n=1 Tax=Sphaerisporangium aureirubrum TaxID=1544736 RepID=A0ABW1NBR3_9ACTN
MPELEPLGRGDPQQLGPYKLTGRIGEGGQGVVYLGRDAAGQRVAVKLLHVKFTGDVTARSRFARELKAAERVSSFCTAKVVHADLDGDIPYIASEYIEGRSLREAVEAGGPLTGSALERLAVGMATALTAIHHAGIVHRDFKPDNVLMAADGPRVVDFGIARILDSTGTITSRAVGTPAYMAPEQISGAEVGPPADVFAWGSTLAFAATGTVPFAGNSIAAVLNRVLNDDADLSGLPEPLRGVVRASLTKQPAERPTADEILLRLLGRGSRAAAAPTALLTEGLEVAARVTAAPPPPGTAVAPGNRPRRRRRWAAVAAALLVLATGGALAAWQWGPYGAMGTPTPTPPVVTTTPPSSPTPTSFDSVADKAAATRKLTIAMRDLVPGIALNSSGNWRGFEVDVGTYIAKQLGVPANGVTFRASSRDERIGLLDSGKADLVIATYSINDDPVTFAGPYYTAHVDVLVRAGDPITRLADLSGRKMCSPASNASVGIVQGKVKVQLVPAFTYADCMALLHQGVVDAIPGDDLLLAGFAQRDSIRYKVLGAKLSDERYGVAVKKGDVRTCRAIRGAIAQMYEDGTVAALLRRHFDRVEFRPELRMPNGAACR